MIISGLLKLGFLGGFEVFVVGWVIFMINYFIFFLCFRDDSLFIIFLYQLVYNKKIMYSNYGVFYEVKLIFDFKIISIYL